MVTGGAGFIGSAVCRRLVNRDYRIVNVDKLTYAGSLTSVAKIEADPRYTFEKADVCDEREMLRIMTLHDVDAVMHLAAETHVDRSIDGPEVFVETNVLGTFRLLCASAKYFGGLDAGRREQFRFHHVSTDEVFGSLSFEGGCFSEETPYAPSSPYAASKASSDHIVRAWHVTYGLPVVLSNCSNTYGPYHFPEKLIPLTILNALEEKPLTVYGRGQNVRDWLYVDDHAEALEYVLTHGRTGESYNIGGGAEQSNADVVRGITRILDAKRPRRGGGSYADLITYVADRPGHDLRYAMDNSKAKRDLGWAPRESFESGLEKTIDWFLENEWWWGPIRRKTYDGVRLGAL